MIPYTREQWNHLIRQGDPEAGHALGGDLASWRPKVERICARYGLSLDGEMQWRSSGASVRCTNAVFLSDDLAVKVYARRSPIWFRREVESLRVLGDVPETKTPRLLAYGDAISEADPDHPYLIMEPLLHRVRLAAARATRREATSQALHAAPPVSAAGRGGAVAGGDPRCAVADLMSRPESHPLLLGKEGKQLPPGEVTQRSIREIPAGFGAAKMNKPPLFKCLVVASKAKDHLPMIASAEPFFAQMAAENQFAVDFTDDAGTINEENLGSYQVFVMLHLAPFDMSSPQQEALQNFIESGKGWVGIHAAGLAGKQFVGSNKTYWQWFEDFLGGVTYSPHPAYQKGTVLVEDRRHPATKNLPAQFEISDEWYEFNGNPRDQAHILATADEATYQQNKPMGDHPIVWTNERYRRAIYIAIGHDPSSLTNEAYCILLRDSILWAASA